MTLPLNPPSANAIGADANAAVLVKDLVIANHILYDTGVLDAYGHVSARDPANSERFLLSRSMAPSLVGARDIIEYDLNGEPVHDSSMRSYVERFIHSEVYRARPDVLAIVHSHSVSVLPFAISSVDLRPVFHMAGFLKRVSRFEIRAVAGDGSNLLVDDSEKGRYLANVLSDNCVSLMRGHGMVVVGGDLREVVYRSVYAEINARVQMQTAMLGGQTEFLSDAEAASADRTAAQQYERSWALWKENAERVRENYPRA